MGHLNVWMTANSVKTLLMKKSFNQGADVWFESGAFIGAQTNFSIMIEGVVGQSYTSDVALDDVGFRNCGENELPVCNFAEFTCGNGRCIPLDQVCDLVDHCWDGSDENDCGKLKHFEQ